MFFLQQLGGCIFTTVGQTILSNLLVSELTGIPGIDPSMIVNEGATKLASVFRLEIWLWFSGRTTRLVQGYSSPPWVCPLVHFSVLLVWNGTASKRGRMAKMAQADLMLSVVRARAKVKRQRRPSKWSIRALKTRAEDNCPAPGCGKRV
jgi:hypothetical protein